jgi:hypothetical protein
MNINKLLLVIVTAFLLSSCSNTKDNTRSPSNKIAPDELTYDYIKSQFREVNAEMTPFMDPTDYDLVEEERRGPGWRFVSSNYKVHKNVIVYNHGHKGRKRAYYKFANGNPRKEKPGRDLYEMSEWFNKYNVTFSGVLRKETDDFTGSYGRSIEPIEVFHHMRNTLKRDYNNDVTICYVGHSEGAASVLFNSMYVEGAHVAISPGYGKSPFKLTGKRFSETSDFYDKANNLSILLGGDEILTNMNTLFENTKDFSDNINVNVIGNLNHIQIAGDTFINEWGPAVLAGCKFKD